MMILVVLADSRDIDNNRNASLVKSGFVAETRPLEKQWGSERTTGIHHKFSGLDILNIGSVLLLEGRV